MEIRMSVVERMVNENSWAIEKIREKYQANFQRLGDMMEDVLCRMKNMERGSEGSEGSVYGNRLGKTEDTEEE